MQQYAALKSSYPHAILFFRLGDFYEMFAEDARTAAAILGVVLTSRGGVPMCGIPYHSSSNYIAKLLAAGRKVAICEQIAPTAEEAKKSKLFRREVVRLITPGTIVEDELLQTKTSNYLAAVSIDIVGWGLSYLEASTGEFFSTQNLNDPDFYQLAALLSKVAPSEIIADARTETERFAKEARAQLRTQIDRRTQMAKEKIEQAEADQLGQSIQNVARHYDIPGVDQKTVDWIRLARTLGMVYGTRLFAARMSAPKQKPNEGGATSKPTLVADNPQPQQQTAPPGKVRASPGPGLPDVWIDRP